MEQPFPPGFLWGAATSSYQIEGAVHEDGRGSSIWDDFSRRPGAIIDGSNGDVACDHYHRFNEDVALMAGMGLQAYRFSIAWPRILPDGTGAVEQRGLDFYNRVIDACLANGIVPFATLYHWDLPSALQARGGWGNRDIAGWFADYSAICARAFGDRVKHWITLNEPWCIAFLCHEIGAHAPGQKDGTLARAAAHHCNLAHGAGMQAIRACTTADTQVGIALNFGPVMPLTDSAEDKAAAAIAHSYDQFYGWFSTPILKGFYPQEMVHAAALRNAAMPAIRPGDMALISQRNDFMGVNYYTPTRIRAGADGRPAPGHLQDAEYTLMDWEVEPKGLELVLHELHAASNGKTPLYITENGASFADEVIGGGVVHDEARVNYFRSHLAASHDAMQAGVDLRGYFAWSLMDNFEWAKGYQQFFGMVHVDYATQRRTIKDSGHYFSQVIRANAVI